MVRLSDFAILIVERLRNITRVMAGRKVTYFFGQNQAEIPRGRKGNRDFKNLCYYIDGTSECASTAGSMRMEYVLWNGC